MLLCCFLKKQLPRKHAFQLANITPVLCIASDPNLDHPPSTRVTVVKITEQVKTQVGSLPWE